MKNERFTHHLVTGRDEQTNTHEDRTNMDALQPIIAHCDDYYSFCEDRILQILFVLILSVVTSKFRIASVFMIYSQIMPY